MAEMKICTDIEQSKKLAEILPLESADMRYGYIAPYDFSDRKYDGGYDEIPYHRDFLDRCSNFSPEEYDGELFCWSLTALLDLLPNEIQTADKCECKYQIDIRKYDGGNNVTLYQIAYGNRKWLSGSWHDMINTGEKENLIDCCVQMIELLNKRGWL